MEFRILGSLEARECGAPLTLGGAKQRALLAVLLRPHSSQPRRRPWLEAARTIADGDLAQSVEIVARIGAHSVEAYARLRAAEELSRTGRLAEVHDLLEPALAFFRHVGATRYLAQADKVLAGAA